MPKKGRSERSERLTQRKSQKHSRYIYAGLPLILSAIYSFIIEYEGMLNPHPLSEDFIAKRSKATLQPIHIDADPLFDESPLLELAGRNPGRLFQFSRQRVDQFIRVYGAAAGIHPDKLHSHAVCKHSLAMLLWDSSHSLGMIRSYLGHRAASSSLCYLAEADARKAQDAVAGITI